MHKSFLCNLIARCDRVGDHRRYVNMVIRRCTLIMNARVFVQKCSGLRLAVRARKRDREPKHNAPKVGMKEGEREREKDGGKDIVYVHLRLLCAQRA